MTSCHRSPGRSAVKGRGNSRSMPAEHRGRCSPTQSPVGLLGGPEPGSMPPALEWTQRRLQQLCLGRLQCVLLSTRGKVL